MARANAVRLGARVAFAAADLAGCLDLEALDLLVSNPPYVAPEDAPSLSPEVREFEPHRALFARGEGEEGSGGRGSETAVIARLLRQARGLRPGTPVIVEVGAGQMDEVRRLALAGSWRLERAVPDLAGIERVALLRRR